MAAGLGAYMGVTLGRTVPPSVDWINDKTRWWAGYGVVVMAI